MANEQKLHEDLSKWFDTAVTAESAIMDECIQICFNYNLSGADLFFKWEALSFNSVPSTPSAGTSRTIQTLTLDGAKALRAHIAREVARTNEKHAASTTRSRGLPAALANRMRLTGTPNRDVPSPTASGMPRVDRTPLSAPAVDFLGPTAKEAAQRTYRYMFEKTSVRSEALDDRIDEFSELIRDKYDIEELGDPASVTEDVVTVVGRICLDPEADTATSSKLSSTTLVLEASRMGGSGERVPLKFEPDFTIAGSTDPSVGKSLFPGEIVALRGRNGGGGWFSVREVLPVPPITPSPRPRVRGSKVLIASGPYTPEQSFDLTPFLSVIEEAKIFKPSVLLLLGPFIDTSHASVKSGKLSASPLSLFQQAYLNPIQSLLQHNPNTLVLLVPSVRDLLNSHDVFPQGVGEGDFGPLHPFIKVLPNPCHFSLNGVKFGVSTVDVLYHIKNQQYIQRPQQQPPASEAAPPQDAMANLCRHVLEQRSFYPIFPVPFELSSDVNLDITHSEHLRLDPAPDVLVLPSILKQFCKDIEGTTVINTSVFGKSRVAGQLYIRSEGGEDCKVCDNAKVVLKRLA